CLSTSGSEGQDLFLRYYKLRTRERNPHDPIMSDEMRFRCSLDGETCTMVSGESGYLFKPGCQLKADRERQSVTFSCPGSPTTWTYALRR
ncbi:MAG TPA: hypothetical protein VM598_03655, partial [Bdellovibrionota bacterium]|nr:hypothetical protein [Bdellovibrionota bacterium]